MIDLPSLEFTRSSLLLHNSLNGIQWSKFWIRPLVRQEPKGPIQKYTNAKRSIPAHSTLFNDAHCDLHLWPVTSKINRVYSHTMANMSAKFDEEAHSGFVSIVFKSLFLYMSIVTLNFDLWPPKSIGFILTQWLTCLQSLMKKHTAVLSLSCSKAYYHTCLLWPWPLTSDLQNRNGPSSYYG